MRLYVRSVRNRLGGGHFATAPLLCAPCRRRDSRSNHCRVSPPESKQGQKREALLDLAGRFRRFTGFLCGRYSARTDNSTDVGGMRQIRRSGSKR